MPIVVIGLSHHTSPVTVRERFAFADTTIPGALQTLKERGVVDEAVIVSTCNRVELYAATSQTADHALGEIRKCLVEHHAYEGELNGEVFGFAEPRSGE